MNKGKLTFTGQIDLNQFWPQNVKTGNRYDSDADTVKVHVTTDSATFTPAVGASKKTGFLQKAGFFNNVTNKTTGQKKLTFKPAINSAGDITMRLQGIDAPELHYSVGKTLYRQHWGNISTVELYKFLKSQTSGSSIECEVVTQVDKPNDVFDKFGRCVGDVLIKTKGGKMVNINHWLAENGYAFPAYYNSMTASEIDDVNKLAEAARAKKLNIWSSFSQKMSALDRTLTHSSKDGTYSRPADAKKPVIFPKLFRRLWTFEIQKKQQFTTTGYQKFLMSGTSDICCDTKTFLKSGFPKKGVLFGKFVSPSGDILFKPADIVFKEAGTNLKDKNGQKIDVF